MSPALILAVLAGYFGLILVISFYTSRGSNSLESFFLASRRAPWYVVAFGMIGTSISGATFISVPGAVGTQQMGYMQVVLGYIAGYLVIAFVLLPLYYRLRLTSIYTYLELRFGRMGYKTGAAYFLLSRGLGSAARLYLVAVVYQYLVFEKLGVPFWLTTAVCVLLILLFTIRGGIRTIVWTDTLQTGALVGAVAISVFILVRELGITNLPTAIQGSDYGRVFFWDPKASNYFWKEFLSGLFICVTMTGLDQDLMQKNLSIRTLRDAQKNVLSTATAITLVNLLFVTLGVLLYLYVAQKGLALPPKTDQLYAMIAFEHLGTFAALLFLIGLTAAAYASADGALTALTTSFCVDILGIRTPGMTKEEYGTAEADAASTREREAKREAGALRTKHLVHLGMALATLLIVLLFRWSESWQTGDVSVIRLVLRMAVYTYGPLLGLFAFGMLTRWRVRDRLLPLVCIASPLLCMGLATWGPGLLGGYIFGNELIVINGAITFLGCYLLRTHKGELV